jgi:predicted secreted protein
MLKNKKFKWTSVLNLLLTLVYLEWVPSMLWSSCSDINISQTQEDTHVQKTFTIADNDKSVLLKPEERFEILLPDFNGLGYMLSAINYVPAVVVLENEGRLDTADKTLDGSFGQIYWRFKTLSAGQSDINILVQRSGESKRKYFGIHLEVIAAE